MRKNLMAILVFSLLIFMLLLANSVMTVEHVVVQTATDYLLTGATGSQKQRILARTSDNHLHAAYYKLNATSSNYEIYYSESNNNGLSWNETQLTKLSATGQQDAMIAVDSKDRIYVFWDGEYGGLGGLQIRYKVYNNSWSQIFNATADNIYYQYYPHIAINSTDVVHLVWLGDSANLTKIRYKYSTELLGTGELQWSSLYNISDPTIVNSGDIAPSLAIDNNDIVHFVWEEGNWDNGDFSYIQYRNFNGNSLSSTINVTKQDGSNTYNDRFPTMIVDCNNTVHILWMNTTTVPVTAIQYRSFNGITWSTVTDIYEDENISHEFHSSSITLSKNGTKTIIHAIWETDLLNGIGEYEGTLFPYCNYTSFWSNPTNITESLVRISKSEPCFMYANYPNISSIQTNIPTEGFAYLYLCEEDWIIANNITYHASDDLSFGEVASPPFISNEIPLTTSTGVDVNLQEVNATIIDINGDAFDWKIGGTNITTNSSIGDVDGIKHANVVGPLAYSTVYTWWVNATDVDGTTNETYTFTTETFRADTVYVDDNFSPSTPGWNAGKYRNISDAYSAVNTNWTIFIYPGIYNESLTILKSINISGISGTYYQNNDQIILNCNATSDGLKIKTNHTNISGFTILNPRIGINMSWASNGSIKGMIIYNSSEDCIYLSMSSNNLIIKNNFTAYEPRSYWAVNASSTYSKRNNYYQNNFNSGVIRYFAGSYSKYNSSYPIGGNYWSGLVGATDIYRGQGQNVSGADGFSDTAYNFDGFGNDYYPLMNPYEFKNHAPLVYNPLPTNAVSSVSLTYPNLRITLFDQENDALEWMMQCKYITNVHLTGATNGTKIVAITSTLPPLTVIRWYVNVSDGTTWTNKSYSFTTQTRLGSTIQEAIDAAAVGGTVFVYAGIYSENIIINKTITLVGENVSNTTIDGSGTGDVVYITADDVVLKNFTINNSGTNDAPNFDSGIDVRNGSNVHIEGNNISDNNFGLFAKNATSLNATFNYFDSNSEDGIKLYACNSTEIFNNSISSNLATGINITENSTESVVSRNNISSNIDNGIGIYKGSSNNVIYLNNISDNRNGIYLQHDIPNNCENNLIYNNNFFSNIHQGRDDEDLSNSPSLTTRPNADGDTNDLYKYGGTSNYKCVNETISDYDLTYITDNPAALPGVTYDLNRTGNTIDLGGGKYVDGTSSFIFVSDTTNGLKVYNATTYTSITTIDDGGTYIGVDSLELGNNNYVAVACYASGLRMYNFTYTSPAVFDIVLLDTIDIGNDYRSVHIDSVTNNIYCGHGAGMDAFSFDYGGTDAFTLLGSLNDVVAYEEITDNGTFNYACYRDPTAGGLGSGICAFQFDGANFNIIDTNESLYLGSTNQYYDVFLDINDYIYVSVDNKEGASQNDNIGVYTFNGTNFILQYNFTLTSGVTNPIYIDGDANYFYITQLFQVADPNGRIQAYTLYDGTDMTLLATNTSDRQIGVFSTGGYAYTGGYASLQIYQVVPSAGLLPGDKELYKVTDHAFETWEIGSITITACIKMNLDIGESGDFYLVIHDGANEQTSQKTILAGNDWEFYTATFLVDPSGTSWDWNDIDDLQIGIILGDGNFLYLTQIYSEVNYAGSESNRWNNSYPIGGNYYDDFDETSEGAYDRYNGPLQNILGADGIVDGNSPNPYDIFGIAGSEDFYPLIHFISGVFGPSITPGSPASDVEGMIEIPPLQPPKYPNNPFTVPEMYQLLRATIQSNSKVVIVVIDSGINQRTYNSVDLSPVIVMKNDAYQNGGDTFGHGCIDGDSYIYIGDGLIKIKDFYESTNIKPISTNAGLTKLTNAETLSLTNEGYSMIDEINAVHKVEVNETIKITTIWNKSLILTPWHPTPVIVNNEIIWKRADEITIDDYIACPINTVDFGEYQKIIVYRRMTPGPQKLTKETIVLDEDLAWLIGFTIGDGTVCSQTNQVMLHDEKRETLEKAIKIAETHGYTVGKGIRSCLPKQNSYVLSIYSGLDKLFLAMGYNNSRKNIPDEILKSPSNVRAAFIAGIFDADGYCWETSCKYRNPGEIRVIVSSNEELCKKTVIILDSLGLPSSYEKILKAGYGNKKGNNDLFAVTLKQKWNLINFLDRIGNYVVSFKKDIIYRNIKNNMQNSRYVVFLNDFVGLKIRKIEKNTTDTFFYDLSTIKYNNYYASGFMIHNTFVNYEIRYGIQNFVPNAVQYSIKAFDGYGRCTPETFLESMELAKSLNPDIITISAGAKGTATDEFAQKVNELRSAGIFVTVSAGNDGPRASSITSPATSADAVAVGATDPMQPGGIKSVLDLSDDLICIFSSRGPVNGAYPKPDIVCPGESIIGPWSSGEKVASGTSMSAPLAAAVGLQVIASNKLLMDIVKFIYGGRSYLNIVESSITDSAYGKGSPDDYGYGIPNTEIASTVAFIKCILAIISFLIAVIAILLIVAMVIKTRKKK